MAIMEKDTGIIYVFQKNKIMRIPFFNYQHIFKSREDKLIEIIKDVGNRGAFILT